MNDKFALMRLQWIHFETSGDNRVKGFPVMQDNEDIRGVEVWQCLIIKQLKQYMAYYDINFSYKL